MEFKALRGTRDMLPQEAQKWDWLEAQAKQLFELYGYQRIITPTFEATELFRRGIGETTDIVQKEMYTFLDRKKRSLTLRPEGTAPVVRAYLEHNLDKQANLVKLYYTGPMYRYERPQKGRMREFYQLGVEAIGSNDPLLDAEVVSLSLCYLEALGLKKLKLSVNSMGCQSCRKSFLKELKGYLQGSLSKLCSDCQKRAKTNPLRVFDCKNKSCQAVLKGGPLISDYLCTNCSHHFDEVKKYLQALKVAFEFKPSLVRGFDYYTQTTFEIESPYLGAQNALGGGGRYDGLVEEYGGAPTPAVGFALGAERIILVLEEEKGDFAALPALDVLLIALGQEAKEKGAHIIASLRDNGIAADLDYNSKSLKSQLRLASKLGVDYALLLGSNELEEGTCIVKEMRSSRQSKVEIDQVKGWLQQRLKRG